MAETFKVLGQADLAATTETDLYTVPGATSAIISSIVVCNRGATGTTFRLSIDVGGSGTANKDYTHFDHIIPANFTYIATIGPTLAAADVLKGYAGNGNLSMNVFGTEIA